MIVEYLQKIAEQIPNAKKIFKEKVSHAVDQWEEIFGNFPLTQQTHQFGKMENLILHLLI